MQPTLATIPRGRYDQAAALLARVFRDDPGPLALMKGIEAGRRIRGLTIYYRLVLKNCGSGGMPLEATVDNEMAAACLIYQPLGYPPPVSAQVSIFLEGLIRFRSPATFVRGLRMQAALEKRHPKQPHYYLEMIGVDPRFRAQGIGSSMLQRMTSLADEQRVGCYLWTSTPGATSFYRRFGFDITGEDEVMGAKVWFIWRPSVTGSRV